MYVVQLCTNVLTNRQCQWARSFPKKVENTVILLQISGHIQSLAPSIISYGIGSHNRAHTFNTSDIVLLIGV